MSVARPSLNARSPLTCRGSASACSSRRLPRGGGWPSWPSSTAARPKKSPTVQSVIEAQPPCHARHEREVVGARREPGREAAQAHAEHRGHRLVAAHVHEHPERSVAEAARLAAGEGGGHAVRHDLALAQRVLGRGRGGRLAALGRVGHRGGVADRPDVLAPRDPHGRVHHDAAVRPERKAEPGHRGRGPHAGGPGHGAGGDSLPGAERGEVRLHGVEHRARSDLDPAPAQLARGERGQARRDLGHDPVLRLHQEEAGALHAAARVAVDHVGHVVLQLGHALHAGVARAHEDEGEKAPFARPGRDAPPPPRGSRWRGSAGRSRRPGSGSPRRAPRAPARAAPAAPTRAPRSAGRSGASRRDRRSCAARSR